MSANVLYRYDATRRLGGWSIDLDHLVSGRWVELNCYEYAITRTTPHGVWIDAHGTAKFILNGARKRFAYPTKLEALQSFIARKNRQLAILTDQMEYANMCIEKAANIITNVEDNTTP